MRPPVRPPRLRCALFPLTYPPHLLVLPATFGLHLFWQTYPYFRALYVISVRRTKGLPTASFRFHLTMDTLAVQLYTSSLPRRVRDFHPLERAHGAQTKKTRPCERTGLHSCYHLTSRKAHTLRLNEYPSILRQISVPPAKPTLYISALLLRDVFSLLPCLRLSPPGSSLSAFRQRYFFPSSRSRYSGFLLYSWQLVLSRKFHCEIFTASMPHSHSPLRIHTFQAKSRPGFLW